MDDLDKVQTRQPSRLKELEFFQCNCEHPDHVFQVASYPVQDPEDLFVYVSYHLKPAPFFYRVWYAIKYIYGTKENRYFDDVLLDVEDSKRLRDRLSRFLISADKYNKRKKEETNGGPKG